ncbi:hypothetical protein C923_00683 [Plasmodium falciparum UGT5.1]|uniref:Uncharacterized protein n=1 Tax=Plasmodium falciparum UGT5.1 TaxID=1237627 RepID=W7JUT4_PLAFA|nr:hypothetical protein C923_00683 [Plasmodium falciparum UGT5.1]
MVHQFQVFHHIVHDQLYIQNGTICVQLCLYFVCTLIFIHSPFSPSTFGAQLTCTSKHLGGVYQFFPIFVKIFGPFFGHYVGTIFIYQTKTIGKNVCN